MEKEGPNEILGVNFYSYNPWEKSWQISQNHNSLQKPDVKQFNLN